MNFLSIDISYAQETALPVMEKFPSASKKSELSFTLLPDSLCNYNDSNTFSPRNQGFYEKKFSHKAGDRLIYAGIRIGLFPAL